MKASSTNFVTYVFMYYTVALIQTLSSHRGRIWNPTTSHVIDAQVAPTKRRSVTGGNRLKVLSVDERRGGSVFDRLGASDQPTNLDLDLVRRRNTVDGYGPWMKMSDDGLPLISMMVI